MRVFRHFENLLADMRGSAVAVGNFDGVHLGHAEVIGEAGRIARAAGRPWAVLTLEPHPRSVFDPNGTPFRLTPLPAKIRLIERLGPDALIIIPFDAAFARTPPRAFVEQVVVDGLAARHVVCGHDFAFGHGRRGTPELLLWMGEEFDFGFTCVQEVRDDGGEPYSSTRVREFLLEGQPEAAARLLGRPFAIESEVVEGDRRGRTLGFPTANQRLGEYLRPMAGVYAVRARTLDGTLDAAPDGEIGSGGDAVWNGVANLGLRPTFGGSETRLETHLFDTDADLYGRLLAVELQHFLRPEKKFDGIEALRAQIGEDCARARRLLAADGDAPRVRASGR